MNWRYSLRTLLVASTALALMIGISAASYRHERAEQLRQRRKIEVVYDYGKFRSDVPAFLADALEKGTDLELVPLHPMQYKASPANNFHGWMELGRISITDRAARERIVAALRGSVTWWRYVVA
jgi:hypothetical protein